MTLSKALCCTVSMAALFTASQASAQAPAGQAPAGQAPAGVAQVEEVVVTGTSIRGIAPVGAPVLKISSEEIAASGTTSPVELLRELPQVVNIGADETRVGSGANQATANTFRASGINIRGLGTQATLTLVDGQRPAPGGLLASSFDPSTIPNIALAGIDVVADGASAIYGADALAGVVNLILRKKFHGAEVAGAYSFADDYYNYEVSGVFGRTSSRGSFMVAGEYAYHPTFWAHSRPNLFIGAGTGVSLIPSTTVLEPHQVPNSYPGTLVAGGITYALPLGGTAPVTAAQVLAGRNLRYVTNTWTEQAISPATDRKSVVGNFQYDLTDTVELFGQAYFSRRAYVSAGGPGGAATMTIRSTNPYAAFLTQLPGAPTSGTVQYSFNQIAGKTVGEEDQGQAMLGARTDLWGDFQGELTVTQNYSHNFRYLNGGTNACALTGTATNVSGPCTVPGGALGQTSLATAFNPFGLNSQAVLDTIRSQTLQAFQVQLRQIRAKIDGTLFNIAGGGVKVAAGIDYVHQKNWYGNFGNAAGPDNTQWRRNTGGTKQQDITAVFVETVVPLISEANAKPWAQQLQLSLAGRVDKYSIYSDVTKNPKLGLTWQPTDDLVVRASYATSFRSGLKDIDPNNAPNVVARVNGYFDYRCNCSVTSMNRNGGNALVKPETSKTWTLGADYNPAAVEGLNLNLTYFNILYEDIIDQPGNTVTNGMNSAALEALYGAYATRRPAASDVAATAAFDAIVAEWMAHPTFNPGANRPTIASVMFLTSGQSWNSGSLLTRGLDFSTSYRLPTSVGDWTFGLNGTYYLEYARSLTPTGARTDRLDIIDNPTSYRLRGRVGWTKGAWRASATVNHTPEYSNTNVTPAATVKAYNTIDSSLAYTIEGASGLLEGITASVNVRNLLDQDPSYALINRTQTYDSQVGSPFGRTIAMELRKRF